MWPLAIYEICLAVAGALAFLWLPGYVPAEYIQLYHRAAAAGLVLLAAAGPVVLALRYQSSGFVMSDGFVKAASGCFGRRVVAVRYANVQHVTLEQNFIARACGICKGTLHLLAGAGDMAQTLPYFDIRQADRMRERMCGRHSDRSHL